jgi:hypothetical protein
MLELLDPETLAKLVSKYTATVETKKKKKTADPADPAETK